MTKKEKDINVEEVVATINQTLKELRDGVDPSKLNADDRSDILLELEKTTLLAYQLKLKVPIDELVSTSPDLPIRDVVIKLLAHLKPDTSANMIAQVTKYISEEWEKRRLKVAA